MTTLVSAEDASVNFLFPASAGGQFEARYVRRPDAPYFIGYLSSHAGCDKACRMCHLTQLGQTSMEPATLMNYAAQAARIGAHYATLPVVPFTEFMNWNFMARGEPFANPNLTGYRAFERVEAMLRETTKLFEVPRCQINLSTIMPREIEGQDLRDIIGPSRPGVNVYYSLYSMRPEFRRRWLPKAMDPDYALNMLTEWQMSGSGGEVVLHHSFIAGHNDSEEDADLIIQAVKKRGLKTRFNMVRYNPFSPAQGEEPSGTILRERLHRLGDAFGDPRTRIVPRVGMDVKASCGMFVEDAQ